MKNVLLIEPTIHTAGIDILENKFNVYLAPNGEEGTLINYINKYNIDALIIRLEQVTENIIKSCPSLKVIGRHGIGIDNIDIEEATNNKVLVINVPDQNYTTVVEHTLLSILALSKNLLINDKNVRNEKWANRDQHIPMEIEDKNLLIVGMGLIGQMVAKRALAFNMNVYAYDPYVSEEKMKVSGVQKVNSLLEKIGLFDIITIHVPLTESTKNLFSHVEFKKMKESSMIINTSRGGIINEASLYKALIEQEIAGAALDVFEHEPPLNSNLFNLDNVILTPHIAGVSIESQKRTSISLAKGVTKALKGEKPKNIVNPSIINE